jgi:hypothetical protein
VFKKEIDVILTNNIIQESKSEYGSPVLLVQKKDEEVDGKIIPGGLRFCVDFRKINAITKKDRWPLPRISGFPH